MGPSYPILPKPTIRPIHPRRRRDRRNSSRRPDRTSPAMDLPPFQEASRCYVCNCSFNTFRRRHHCRCCGRTLCHEHSSMQMALPQFGIYSNVRVCNDCYNNPSRSKDEEPRVSNNLESTIDKFSGLDVKEETSESIEAPSISNVIECKCGMPLCICEAPSLIQAPSSLVEPIRQSPSISTEAPNSKARKPSNRRKVDVPMLKSMGSNTSKQSVFFNTSANNGTSDNSSIEYEASGEGLKEAIKNHDVDAVRKLLSQGVDANYSDKQGFSLLHLAAMFNQTEITFLLLDHGANADCVNAQGETPLDCAPTMLQHKMKQKLEGNA